MTTILPAVATLLAPVIGFALQASARNRMLRRINDHLALAEKMNAQGETAAAAPHLAFAEEASRVLIIRDRRALRRKFDPAALFALLFVVAPGAIAFVLALGTDEWWTWPVLVVSGLWVVFAGGVGATQLRKEAEDDQEVTEGDQRAG